METARAAKRGRRHNLSLRQLDPRAGRREEQSLDRAFESFYRKHVAEVYQYALAVLTNPADAEDVTQQTFLNAYRAFQKGERPHTPHNWLIKIAHNVCRMRWRQSSRRPQEVPLENAAEPVAPDEKPSLDDVLTALARLPFNQRSAIVMREVEGRTYSEIADVLGTTVPAVEALLFRARTNLRARRKALGVLTLAPLPGSLSSFFGGGGGGLLAAGGAAFGSELVLKAAAIVVSGVVAGGLGFKAVKAVAKPEPSHRLPAQKYRRHRDPSWANAANRVASAMQEQQAKRLASFRHPGRVHRRDGKLQSAPTGDTLGSADAAGAATSGPAGADAAASALTSTIGSNGRVTVEPAPTVTKVVASVPVQTPPAPVPLPVSVAPPPPLPSVTVAVPTLPQQPPPPLK